MRSGRVASDVKDSIACTLHTKGQFTVQIGCHFAGYKKQQSLYVLISYVCLMASISKVKGEYIRITEGLRERKTALCSPSSQGQPLQSFGLTLDKPESAVLPECALCLVKEQLHGHNKVITSLWN